MAEPIVSVSYSLENDKRWNNIINDAVSKIGDLTNPFKLIANDFYGSQTMFGLKSAGQYPDFKTEKLKKAKKDRVGWDYPLLKGSSGKLMRSVTTPNSEGSVLDIKKTYMIIGTDVRNNKGVNYGIFHQSDKPRKIMPLRKFLFIGPEAPRYADSDQIGRMRRWENTMKTYVDKKLKALGSTK